MNKNFNKTKKISVIFILTLFCISLFSGINLTKAETTETYGTTVFSGGDNGVNSFDGKPLDTSGSALSTLYLKEFHIYYKCDDNKTGRIWIINSTTHSIYVSENFTFPDTDNTFTWLTYTIPNNVIIPKSADMAFGFVMPNVANTITTVVGSVGSGWTGRYKTGGTMTYDSYSNSTTLTLKAYNCNHPFYMVFTDTEPYPDEPEVTPEPSITPLPQITFITNVLDFLLGTNTGSLGAGFGFLVWFVCSILGFLISGKNFWGFFAGMNLGFIVNVIGGLWATWVLFLLVLLDVVIILGRDKV